MDLFSHQTFNTNHCISSFNDIIRIYQHKNTDAMIYIISIKTFHIRLNYFFFFLIEVFCLQLFFFFEKVDGSFAEAVHVCAGLWKKSAT